MFRLDNVNPIILYEQFWTLTMIGVCLNSAFGVMPMICELLSGERKKSRFIIGVGLMGMANAVLYIILFLGCAE